MEPRHRIIDFSVQLEENTSLILAKWLGIDKEKSRSLGSTGSNLSFRQKLNLLLDMEVLNKEQIKKLEIFGDIRNKFAHSAQINTYEEVINSIQGLKKRLLNTYPTVALFGDDELDATEFIRRIMQDIVIINSFLITKLNNR